jgi:hypothetical protein
MPGHKRIAVMSPQTRLAHSRRRLRGRWRVPKLDPAGAERAMQLYKAQRRLAILPYPALTLLAGWQLRRSEHAEDDTP